MKDYTKQEVKEFREMMVENYDRCIALDTEAAVDGIKYRVDGDAIIAYGTDEDVDERVIVSDLFDVVDGSIFDGKVVRELRWDKDFLDASNIAGIGSKFKMFADYVVEITNKQWEASIGCEELYLKNNCFIRRNGLKNFINLHTLDLGKTHTIEDKGLSGCTKLTNVDFSRVYSMGHEACSNLKITYADLSNMEYIGEMTFVKCSKLEKIKLSAKCTKVSDNAFFMCDNLHEVEFVGTQKEWYDLSQNIKRWKGHLYLSKYKRIKMRYVDE